MKDLAIAMENRPGALARMGEALGKAGVSIEGGGAWVVDGTGVAHFLFADGSTARQALEAAGIQVLDERDVVVQRLKQAVPGQLGMLTRRMADAGVNIEVLYSDHDHQLILVVDDLAKGAAVSEAWTRECGIEPAPRVPAGWHTVTPRIVVDDPAAVVAFLKRVFAATGEFHA